MQQGLYCQNGKSIIFDSDILKRVMDTKAVPQFRPALTNVKSVAPQGDFDYQKLDESVINALKALIKTCWRGDSETRPTASHVLDRIDDISPNQKCVK